MPTGDDASEEGAGVVKESNGTADSSSSSNSGGEKGADELEKHSSGSDGQTEESAKEADDRAQKSDTHTDVTVEDGDGGGGSTGGDESRDTAGSVGMFAAADDSVGDVQQSDKAGTAPATAAGDGATESAPQTTTLHVAGTERQQQQQIEVEVEVTGKRLPTAATAPMPTTLPPVVVSRMVPDKEEGEASKLKPAVLQKNYASRQSGAVMLEASGGGTRGMDNLLEDSRDKYAIAPCSEKQWVVIGLSEDILVTSITLSSYEKYSSTVKEFQLLASPIFPTAEWLDLGTFTAANLQGEQTFELPQAAFVRYLKLKLLTHYGHEFYCTLSQFKVYGTTMLESFQKEWEASTAQVKEITESMKEKLLVVDAGGGGGPRVAAIALPAARVAGIAGDARRLAGADANGQTDGVAAGGGKIAGQQHQPPQQAQLHDAHAKEDGGRNSEVAETLQTGPGAAAEAVVSGDSNLGDETEVAAQGTVGAAARDRASEESAVEKGRDASTSSSSSGGSGGDDVAAVAAESSNGTPEDVVRAVTAEKTAVRRDKGPLPQRGKDVVADEGREQGKKVEAKSKDYGGRIEASGGATSSSGSEEESGDGSGSGVEPSRAEDPLSSSAQMVEGAADGAGGSDRGGGEIEGVVLIVEGNEEWQLVSCKGSAIGGSNCSSSTTIDPAAAPAGAVAAGGTSGEGFIFTASEAAVESEPIEPLEEKDLVGAGAAAAAGGEGIDQVSLKSDANKAGSGLGGAGAVTATVDGGGSGDRAKVHPQQEAILKTGSESPPASKGAQSASGKQRSSGSSSSSSGGEGGGGGEDGALRTDVDGKAKSGDGGGDDGDDSSDAAGVDLSNVKLKSAEADELELGSDHVDGGRSGGSIGGKAPKESEQRGDGRCREGDEASKEGECVAGSAGEDNRKQEESEAAVLAAGEGAGREAVRRKSNGGAKEGADGQRGDPPDGAPLLDGGASVQAGGSKVEGRGKDGLAAADSVPASVVANSGSVSAGKGVNGSAPGSTLVTGDVAGQQQELHHQAQQQQQQQSTDGTLTSSSPSAAAVSERSGGGIGDHSKSNGDTKGKSNGDGSGPGNGTVDGERMSSSDKAAVSDGRGGGGGGGSSINTSTSASTSTSGSAAVNVSGGPSHRAPEHASTSTRLPQPHRVQPTLQPTPVLSHQHHSNHRRPSSLSALAVSSPCSELPAFSAFSEKWLSKSGNGGGADSATAVLSGPYGNIFNTLTSKISSLEIQQTIFARYIDDLHECYQQQLALMVLEMGSAQVHYESRLNQLTDQVETLMSVLYNSGDDDEVEVEGDGDRGGGDQNASATPPPAPTASQASFPYPYEILQQRLRAFNGHLESLGGGRLPDYSSSGLSLDELSSWPMILFPILWLVFGVGLCWKMVGRRSERRLSMVMARERGMSENIFPSPALTGSAARQRSTSASGLVFKEGGRFFS